jgi:prepilin-type N-terminal cleavage/methylation domain-containing protein
MHQAHRRAAVSLVELIIALVILGLIAAIAIPGLSQGAPVSAESELRRSLATMRNAIEAFYYAHGRYPGQDRSDEDEIEAALAGAVAAQALRGSGRGVTGAPGGSDVMSWLPECTVRPALGKRRLVIVRGGAVPMFTIGVPEAGWVYNPDTGAVAANSDRSDADGVRYDRY